MLQRRSATAGLVSDGCTSFWWSVGSGVADPAAGGPAIKLPARTMDKRLEEGPGTEDVASRAAWFRSSGSPMASCLRPCPCLCGESRRVRSGPGPGHRTGPCRGHHARVQHSRSAYILGSEALGRQLVPRRPPRCPSRKTAWNWCRSVTCSLTLTPQSRASEAPLQRHAGVHRGRR